MSPCIRDVLKHCLWLQKVLYLLLGITFVRPEKSGKIAVLCLFLMHLGTCTVPKGNEETLKEALFGDGGGSFQVTCWAVFWCYLQRDGWSCRSGTRSREPTQPDLSLLPVWWLAAGWSVLSLCELCLSLPVLLSWRQKSVVCFPPDQK